MTTCHSQDDGRPLEHVFVRALPGAECACGDLRVKSLEDGRLVMEPGSKARFWDA